ncbi:MAG: DUF4296 domain-containing protein [Bacteroidales bacterium]|nr:DUF4296 domain-containing protein [Bacteroidales bacterium]
MRALRHILLLGLVLLPLSCSRGRVIPARKLAQVHADMLLADQWLHDHPEMRTQADTTLFYEAVFKKYGYSFKDYDASVRYYLENPAAYAKILKKSASLLDRRRTAKEKQVAAAERERQARLVVIPEEGVWKRVDAFRDSLRCAQD